MLTTTNYGLKKPEGNDVVNIDDLNYNADVIDTKLKEINTNLPLKAPLASPAFTGVPTAPTANNGTNNTQVATTAFVNNALSPINTSLSQKANDTDSARTTTAKTVTGAINELNNNKANNTDNTRTTTVKDVTGAINELNANKVNVVDVYRTVLKSGFTSFGACATNGGGLYRVYQPTDYIEGFGYTSDSDFILEVLKIDDDYITMIAYDVRSARTFLQKRINGTWLPWKEITNKDDFTVSLSASGYQKLPNGLIIQWGTYLAVGTITFPIAFTTAIGSISVTSSSSTASYVSAKTASNFTVAGGGAGTFIAIGY